VLKTICESWQWTGLDAESIIATNDFGNVIVRAADNAYWRICPEEPSCKVIAHSPADFESVWKDEEFQRDWQMRRVVEIAAGKFGLFDEVHCYCLNIPAALGGKYDADNLGTITRSELLGFSSDFARQIKDLPDGTTINFTFHGR
jgi:hypothetical protein